MIQKEIRAVWKKHKLSCRSSYEPTFIEKICPEFGIVFDKKLVYTQDRYREMSDGLPRVDAEDFLLMICKEHKIEPNKERLTTANKMFGEGSRRSCVEEAYLGDETK